MKSQKDLEGHEARRGHRGSSVSTGYSVSPRMVLLGHEALSQSKSSESTAGAAVLAGLGSGGGGKMACLAGTGGFGRGGACSGGGGGGNCGVIPIIGSGRCAGHTSTAL